MELGAPLIELPRLAQIPHWPDGQGHHHFDFALNGDFFPGLVSPLRGRFQIENTVAALTAAWELRRQGMDKITRGAIQEGVRSAWWPGRLELIGDAPLVLLDGAHNPAGAGEVAAFVREHLAERTLRLVYASMRDKAIGEISEVLFPLAAEVYLTQPDQPRAARPEEILSAARRLPPRVLVEPNVGRAMSRALEASSPKDVVLAAGSLFLVGAIKVALRSGELTLAKTAGPSAWAPA
jgi:dihydrofolate synthase/folylpolyglutamate synthase